MKLYMGCGAQIDPSRLEEFEDSSLYVAQPKYDGIWGACISTDEGQKFFSRNGKEKKIDMPTIPIGSIIIGELGYGSQTSRLRSEKLGHSFMDVFDIIKLNNEDITDLDEEERISLLHTEWHRNWSDEIKEYFMLAPRWNKNFRQFYDSEAEGVVLKQVKNRPHSPYKIGSRNPYWVKVKRVLTVDMVIMDYEISDAESFKGMSVAKNITCGVWKDGLLKPLVNVGSFSVQLKADIIKHWNFYKGKVAEIRCFSVFETGSLRHPSLYTIRNDKDSSECTWESLLPLM